MPASALDSAIYRDLFGDAETARLFTDTAELRAMLLVEGALAEAQGKAGLIPETSARYLHRASMEVQIDPAALAAETGENGVPVPALVAAFRKELGAPDHAQYLHWGATSQDITDTALTLRLRQAIGIYRTRLTATLRALGQLAETHAETPMPARTYGQIAVPTSFGAVAANWGQPLLRHLARLSEIEPRLLVVSLGGAAGTLSVMGAKAAEVRAGLATSLNLADPGGTWHSARDRVGEFAAWATLTAVSLGKIGEDLLLLSQSGIGEVSLGTAGASSTMPQKQNPVGPSVLVALARHIAGLNGTLQSAGLHRQERDGAAWFTEWLTLPSLCIALGRALSLAQDLAETIAPAPESMRRNLDDGLGLIHSEALTFALAGTLPRPDAAARVKALAGEARKTGTPLAALAARDFPDRDWATLLRPEAQLGQAPAEARAFAKAALAL